MTHNLIGNGIRLILLLCLLLYSLQLVASAQSGRRSISRTSSRSQETAGGDSKSSSPSKDKAVCEPVTIPLCKGFWYNLTRMPNMFHHETQEEAGLEAHQFWPLVTIDCSPDLRFFLCSIYSPICLPTYPKPLPPCRSVCERARKGCAPIMVRYGFTWPKRMNCGQFPEFDNPENVLCMDRNSSSSSKQPDTSDGQTESSSKEVTGKKNGGGEVPNFDEFSVVSLSPRMADYLGVSDPSAVQCSCKCAGPLVPILKENKAFYNVVSTGGQPNCALPCHSPHFPSNDRKFARFWVGLWAILCLLSTLATVVTFLVNTSRFKYPERPIVFLSACYLMISIGFVIRLIVGHENLACDVSQDSGVAGKSGKGVRKDSLMLKYASGDSRPDPTCMVVFLLVYYFGMASSIWWVVLTVTWFLAAGLKWGSEAIDKYARVYHLLAWLFPGLQTLAVLLMSGIDGDPVSGICYVGNTSSFNLIMFVVGPLTLYLVVGALFLLSGFVALFRIRSVIKLQVGVKTDKLEKLMIRIGIFSVLYAVPAAVVIACSTYELWWRPVWQASLACQCVNATTRQRILPPHRPEYAVFMLKYFMCVIVGITSGFWIWSGKTLDSWRSLFYRLGCTKTPPALRGRLKYTQPVIVQAAHSQQLLHPPPTPATGYPQGKSYNQAGYSALYSGQQHHHHPLYLRSSAGGGSVFHSSSQPSNSPRTEVMRNTGSSIGYHTASNQQQFDTVGDANDPNFMSQPSTKFNNSDGAGSYLSSSRSQFNGGGGNSGGGFSPQFLLPPASTGQMKPSLPCSETSHTQASDSVCVPSSGFYQSGPISKLFPSSTASSGVGTVQL